MYKTYLQAHKALLTVVASLQSQKEGMDRKGAENRQTEWKHLLFTLYTIFLASDFIGDLPIVFFKKSC